MTEIQAAPEVEWLVRGVVPVGGVSMLIGPPKAGKTMLTLGLLKEATTGGQFLGSDSTDSKPVWYFSEQSERSLAAQIRIMHFDPNEHISFALWRKQPTYDDPADFAQALLDAYYKAPANTRPEIIVIDTVGTFVDFRDLNDYSQVSDRLAPIIDVGQIMGNEVGTATLLIHHSRKGGDGSERSLGSTKVAACVDTLVHLSGSDTDRRQLSVQSRFGESELGPDINVTLDLEKGAYQLVDSIADVENEIIAMLGGGAMKKADIRAHLKDAGVDASDATVGRRLSALVKNYRIARVGRGPSTTYTQATGI